MWAHHTSCALEFSLYRGLVPAHPKTILNVECKTSILKKNSKEQHHILDLHTVREVNYTKISKSLHDWGQGRPTCYYFSFLLAVTLQWLQQVKVTEII